jgi:hypothetical protein
MTIDRIKSMVDTKLKVDFTKFTNEQIIAELSSRVEKYKSVIAGLSEREGTKARYMNMWIEAAQERILDITEVNILEKKLNKLNRIKILELVDLKKKINN